MSLRRLLLTAAAMTGVGVVLHGLTPGWSELTVGLLHPQRLADTAGADALVLCVAGALVQLVWAWGALGLLLTAVGALPGAAGALGRLLARAVLPAAARRTAALALGLGIGLNGPLLAGAALAAPVPPAAVPVSAAHPVPDWPADGAAAPSPAAPSPAAPSPAGPSPAGPSPAAPSPAAPPSAAPVPDWPFPAPAGAHVVVRGDCLWTIAADRLRSGGGQPPSEAEIATAVHAWWTANARVIGPDPDRLLPGQVLRPPSP